MHYRYPISGIKQSYRRRPGRRTVVIPVLMGATMLGFISFFFWSEPVVEIDPASISEIVVEDETATDVVEQLTFVESSVEKYGPAILAPVDAGETEEEEIPASVRATEIGTTIKEMSERGYKLYQTQSYERPDGSRRFQGVWQREIDDSRSVAGTSGETSSAEQ